MKCEKRLHRYINLINQEDFDKWAKGERTLADLVRQHHFLASLYKSRIEKAIHEHSPHEFLEIFEEERPDIDFRSEDDVEERIREEMKEIEKAL